MIYAGQQRTDLRRAYLDAWRRFRAGELLTPLDAQIAQVIAEHPEYHAWFESEQSLARDFDAAAGGNPFLHLGMHLALRDQVTTDRPPGLRAACAALAARHGQHAAEHRIMEVLGRVLWDAQRAGRAPDELEYLDEVRRLR
jgi:hypothetical protein